VGSGTHKITASYHGDAAHAASRGSADETVSTPTSTPPTRPTVANAQQSHRRWREGNRLASFSRRRPPVGTTFSFTLNEQARVNFTFTQLGLGRKVKGKCVAQTKANRHRRACERAVTDGTIVFTGHPGLNKVSFQGRLSPSKKLGPGGYTLTINAVNSAEQTANPQTLHFTIVK
jgi:hypothetical protein